MSDEPRADDASSLPWRGWYVAALSKDVSAKAPRACQVGGRELVLFRDSTGRVRALDDRCPHRNVPLSLGRVRDGAVECGYHGWTFDSDGACVRIPALVDEDRSLARRCRVDAFTTLERDGLVWIKLGESEVPPLELAETRDPGYVTLWFDVGEVRCDVANVLENFIDQTHPAFLHRGLAYSDGRRARLTVQISPIREGDRTRGVEVEYLGETLPSGAFSSLTGLSPDAKVEHRERFFLPTIHQLEGVFGPGWRFVATQFCTPVSDASTRVYTVLSYRAHVLGPAMAPVIRALVKQLLRQDYVMLAAQRATIERRGKQQFRSTELDRGAVDLRALLGQYRRGQDAPTHVVVESTFVADL